MRFGIRPPIRLKRVFRLTNHFLKKNMVSVKTRQKKHTGVGNSGSYFSGAR